MDNAAHTVPGQRIDTSDPVVARYLQDRARQAGCDGTPVAPPAAMTETEHSMAGVAMTFSPMLGLAAMKFAEESEQRSRAGDRVGAERAARNANRLVLTAITVAMGSALAMLAMLWFAG